MVSSTSPSGSGLGCQVRCSGCREILNVPPGISEFSCPRCKLPQMLPPELLSKGSRGSAVASGAAPQGIDPTKIQLPCAHCKALLNVPHGLARFACPQCGVDLAVDLTKLQHYLSSMANHPLMLPGFGDDVAEEVNEVPFLVYFAFNSGCFFELLFLVRFFFARSGSSLAESDFVSFLVLCSISVTSLIGILS